MSEHDRPFKAVEWQRKTREAADEEIRRIGYDEFSRRMMEQLAGDPLWRKLEHRKTRSACTGTANKAS